MRIPVAPDASGRSLNGGSSVLSHLGLPCAYAPGIVESQDIDITADSAIPVAMTATKLLALFGLDFFRFSTSC
jgi:hypothetical protein